MIDITEARERVIHACLRRAASERGDENASSYAAELEYCDEMILEAARELIAATDRKD